MAHEEAQEPYVKRVVGEAFGVPFDVTVTRANATAAA